MSKMLSPSSKNQQYLCSRNYLYVKNIMFCNFHNKNNAYIYTYIYIYNKDFVMIRAPSGLEPLEHFIFVIIYLYYNEDKR